MSDSYTAPLDDTLFILEHVIHWKNLFDLPGYGHVDSDLARIKTMARVEADGSYRLTGGKIFITFADHDFTEQIIHLVLARTPDAPPGTRGISLFLVPKVLFGTGQANGVRVERLEKKMGLKASPTCVLRLENATGYRIGEEHKGLNAMVTMVNLMRLEVSVQGPAIGAAATAKAISYAGERRQGWLNWNGLRDIFCKWLPRQDNAT